MSRVIMVLLAIAAGCSAQIGGPARLKSVQIGNATYLVAWRPLICSADHERCPLDSNGMAKDANVYIAGTDKYGTRWVGFSRRRCKSAGCQIEDARAWLIQALAERKQ